MSEEKPRKGLSEKDFPKAIEKINKTLLAQAKPKYTNGEETVDNSIQEMDASGGRVLHGFKPQYVVDALNEVIGPLNWNYFQHEVKTHEEAKQVTARVEVVFLVDGHWETKGSQFGQMKIIHNNIGDACKGAVTDAIGKCLSLWSIGSPAYKGLLREIYESEGEPKRTKSPKEDKPKEQETKPSLIKLQEYLSDKKITHKDIARVAKKLLEHELTTKDPEENFKKVLDALEEELKAESKD